MFRKTRLIVALYAQCLSCYVYLKQNTPYVVFKYLSSYIRSRFQSFLVDISVFNFKHTF